METTTKRFSVCFAYFGDGKFLGWYADSFGSIRDDQPKVYGYTERQVQIVQSNFEHKLSKLKESSDLASKHNVPALSLVDKSVDADKKNLLQYAVVELKVVVCPEYDGPNPDFDKEKHAALEAERQVKFVAAGIDLLPAGSKSRIDAVNAFDLKNPRPKRDNWVYCDYSKVRVWAANEPTEFMQVFTAKLS